jgi:hypothetical protein
MIGYFTRAGDWRASAAFNSYDLVFGKLLKTRTSKKSFGSGLDLILIQYHLEGEYLELPKDKYKLLPYRKSERSSSVVVGVPKDFASMTNLAKRNFIVETTVESVRLVQKQMLRLGFTEIDFVSLLEDIQECATEYLNLPEIKFIPTQED